MWMVSQPPTSKTSTAFCSPAGASPFPIPAGRGRYCFKGVGSHADTGRRLFLSGHAPDWDTILHAIREAHKDDTDSAPDSSNAIKLIKDAKKALAVPGSYLDVFTALMCTQLQIRYEKLTEQERTVLKNVMKKTPAYKDFPLSRMKRR